jgi:hypothetical protein
MHRIDVGGNNGTAGGNPEVVATFADGSPAVTRNRGSGTVGKGTAIHFLWLPGLSYWCVRLPSLIIIQ